MHVIFKGCISQIKIYREILTIYLWSKIDFRPLKSRFSGWKREDLDFFCPRNSYFTLKTGPKNRTPEDVQHRHTHKNPGNQSLTTHRQKNQFLATRHFSYFLALALLQTYPYGYKMR